MNLQLWYHDKEIEALQLKSIDNNWRGLNPYKHICKVHSLEYTTTLHILTKLTYTYNNNNNYERKKAFRYMDTLFVIQNGKDMMKLA